jgi:large subunit ribosomal protein L25
MATIEFTAFPRASEGRGASRRLRRSGRAPGIVYGGSAQVLLRDVQMHPYRHEVLHVDFQRIDPNKRIHMKVPLHFANAEVSPAVKVQGALVNHVMTEIDIACLPQDLPEYIEVDLSELDTQRSLHVSGVKMPEGVTPVLHAGLDPVVATPVVPKAAAETEEAPAATEAAAAVSAPAAEAKAGDNKAAQKAVEKKEEKKK